MMANGLPKSLFSQSLISQNLLTPSKVQKAIAMALKIRSTPQKSASQQEFDYDLAIVGGGIVGATLASALKDSGLRVALIEAQAQSAAVAKGRAYAISLLSGRIFKGIGIWDQIQPQITTFEQLSLAD